MKKPILQPPKKATSLSIDEWQDAEPVRVSWFDNPLWGTLMVGCSLFVLFAWGAFSRSPDAKPPRLAVPEPLSLPSDLNPGKMAHDHLTEESQSVSISSLIAELSKPGNGSDYNIKQQLRKKGINDPEIVRRLSKQLEENVDTRKFEGVLLAMYHLSYDSSDFADVKKQVARNTASSGQHFNVAQLAAMDERVHSQILKSSVLPESTDMLKKLSSIDDNMSHRVLTKLGRDKSEDSSKAAVMIVQENNIAPRLLYKRGLRDSETVCKFLWEGKLAGKKDFADVLVGDSEASLKTFSSVLDNMIDQDSGTAVDSLMSCSISGKIRESLSDELVQKIDDALSVRAKMHLNDRLKGESILQAKKRGKNGAGPIAFLNLATRLGGPKTRLAIAETGKSDPLIFAKFESIRDILLSANEPETYDAIVKIWGIHGPKHSKTNALGENIGQSIEPNFLAHLEKVWEQKDQNRQRNISNLMKAIERIGTAKSVAALQKLAKTEESVVIKRLANSAITNIQNR